jgi:hypothetical protein
VLLALTISLSRDVLLRVQSHPNSRIDELLPGSWHSLDGGDSS